MQEWRQTIIAIGTAVLSIIAIVTTMQFQFAGMRAEMRGEHADIRMEMRAGLDTVRAQARIEHAATLNELAAIRDRLNSVDRRTARIEGHLFGVEIAPEPTDGE